MPKKSVEKAVTDAVKSLSERAVAIREAKRGVRRRGIKGRTTGETVTAYIQKVFIANEQRPQHKKWTNTQIKEAMLAEFAHYSDTVRFLSQRRRDPINHYRHRYNKGDLSTTMAPTILSVRYDVQGFAVHNRNVEQRLTRGDYILLLYQYDMNVVFDDVGREYQVLDYSFFNMELFESLEVDV